MKSVWGRMEVKADSVQHWAASRRMLQASSLDSSENDGDGVQTFVLGCIRPKLNIVFLQLIVWGVFVWKISLLK